jgi:hypothetical protein
MPRNPSLLAIEAKARSGSSLSEYDKSTLERTIASLNDYIELQSAIYIYGSNFGPSQSVCDRAKRFVLLEPVPGLTATCIKVVADFWNSPQDYIEVMNDYVDYDKYDEWYDEVIVSTSFLLRHPEHQSDRSKLRLANLRERAEQDHDSGLLDLFTTYG